MNLNSLLQLSSTMPNGYGPDLGVAFVVFLGMLVIVFFLLCGLQLVMRRGRRKAPAVSSQVVENPPPHANNAFVSPVVPQETAVALPKPKRIVTNKTFADVAGCEEAKAELQEIVDYLKSPDLFNKFGARAPRGVLLVGPPGTGKTLLAKAVAGEAGAHFIAESASQFVEVYVGVGASRIRKLFADARRHKPTIIFIDELDAVGKKRATGSGGNQEWDQTLNQLLIEMDGFETDAQVIVIAATNRVDMLDSALIRSGRFDRQVMVDLPDVNGREAIFKVHVKGKPLASNVDLRLLAQRTVGFSGAEIEGACNEAATIAARRYKAWLESTAPAVVPEINEQESNEQATVLPVEITLQDFDEGIDRVQMGIARTTRARAMTREDMLNTAYHEVGHAWIAGSVPGSDPVTKITIVPRQQALGYVQSLPEKDRFSITREHLLARIMMAMAGRAAQEVFLGTADTGASNDFAQATEIARRMVTEFGMSDLGHISLTGRAAAGPELSNRIDNECMKILADCYRKTRSIIERDKAAIEIVVAVLMEKETLLRSQWEELREEAKRQAHQDLKSFNFRMGYQNERA